MIGSTSNVDVMRQEAFDLIAKMNHDEVLLLLRIWKHGDNCMDALIQSGARGYVAILQFIEKWEAETA